MHNTLFTELMHTENVFCVYITKSWSMSMDSRFQSSVQGSFLSTCPTRSLTSTALKLPQTPPTKTGQCYIMSGVCFPVCAQNVFFYKHKILSGKASRKKHPNTKIATLRHGFQHAHLNCLLVSGYICLTGNSDIYNHVRCSCSPRQPVLPLTVNCHLHSQQGSYLSTALSNI